MIEKYNLYQEDYTYENFSVNYAIECPYCDMENNQTVIFSSNDFYEIKHQLKSHIIDNYSNGDIIETISILLCPNCKTEFLHLDVHRVVFTYDSSKVIELELELLSQKIIPIYDTFISKPFFSKEFTETYREALEVKSENTMIAYGMMLRRSLEILIIDFLSSSDPDFEIKQEPLGKLINQINNPKIKEVARRCVWLGNDQTHHHKKWTDFEISDMEILLELVIHHIEMEYLTNQYLEKMDKAR